MKNFYNKVIIGNKPETEAKNWIMPRGATATSVAAPSGAAASSMPPTAATAAEHRLHYEERGSLSRGSVGKGSLGRYSVTTESSVATRHWVNSVSDIYGPDEIEELLDDLNRLELAAFETDDIQDFVIDGSQVGRERHHHVRRGPRGRLRAEAQGGGGPEYRYPSPSAGSPTSSVCSWDSHQVRHHAPQRQVFEVDAGTEGDNDDDDDDCDLEDGLGAQLSAGNGYSSNPSRPMQSIRCFCDTLTFRTPRTILRVLLVVRLILILFPKLLKT